MHVLLVKTSSLGDIIHSLAALTDAAQAYPDLRVDWVVEEAFAEIPAWHPAVERVIPIALRRWRKHPFQAWRSGQWSTFKQALKHRCYDKVLDAQGLIKSAWIAGLARGPRYGLDADSAREGLAAWGYHHKISVPKGQHAVERLRLLFAKALAYAPPVTPVDYGLERAALPQVDGADANTLVFLHGTTWASKHWPERYWKTLAALVVAQGHRVVLPWGNETEYARAQRIGEGVAGVQVLPRHSLSELAGVIAQARGVIGVDTGLAHLAAAFAVPTVTLYGATHAALTGTYAAQQIHLSAQFACAPCLKRDCRYTGASQERPACYETLPPAQVWQAMQSLWQTRQV